MILGIGDRSFRLRFFLKVGFGRVIRANNTVICTWCRFEDEIPCICYIWQEFQTKFFYRYQKFLAENRLII
jgi:hypothetical protein